MEHWEYLKPDGLRFVWDDTLFRPGTDSFLLSSLPKLSAGLRVCDLGCGTGLLGLLLLQRQSELTVTGVDIQPAAVALAERAAAENRLTDRLMFRCIDLRQVRQHFPTGSFDLESATRPTTRPPAEKSPQTAPAAPPAPKRRQVWQTSAPPRPICCGGAENSAWSTSRSGWQTRSAPCGRRA